MPIGGEPEAGLRRVQSDETESPQDSRSRSQATRVDPRGTRRYELEPLEFHMRVRAGYLKMAEQEPERWRVVDATRSVEAVAKAVWGHVSEFMFYEGIDVRGVGLEFSTWPYFISLGLGIGIVQLYLLRKARKTKRPRRPWSLDRRLPLDLLSAYVTLQFFSLITIFRRPCGGSSLLDRCRLILVGLGIDL